MKILFVIQHFRQGWGGGPESVRLMANRLAPDGVQSDVFDRGGLWRNVERLALLPERGPAPSPFPYDSTDSYDAILIVDSWQNPFQLGQLLKRRAPGKPLLYLPRGSLGRIEFARPRDIKKFPYFALVERHFLKASDGIVFSSQAEREQTIGWARHHPAEHVVPDFFTSDNPAAGPFPADQTLAEREPVITCSFLAEVTPRKGLLPLVNGFVAWARRHTPATKVRLLVGGRPRRGSESYYAQAQEVCRREGGAVEVEFLGPVPHGDRPLFYAETDLMIISSRFESFGLTVLEALSAGCAVLSTPDIGALQFLPPHDRLFVTEGAKAADLEHGLERALLQVSASDRVGRARTQRYAADAVAAINRRAAQSWSALLGLS
jgi:glycosyltransferase involved in cell wall biosynthesis